MNNILIINSYLAFINLNNLIELLSLPALQRAIVGGILMGILGGLLGCFVTLRQLSFFSHAVGHAALVGVVLGVLLQINPTWTLLPFTILFGLSVLYLIEQTDIGSDSAFSIAVSAALAIGIILSSFIRGYRANLMAVLFGDILAIDIYDIGLIFLLLLISAIFLLSTLRQQILLTLNPAVAQVQGIPVKLYRYLFIIILSLAVAISIKAVGVLLVNAFLVIPASTAKLVSHQFSRFLIISIIIGAITALVGMMISGLLNLASGPSIIMMQFLLFLLVMIWVKMKK